jgi:anti-anti-sigma regulatory factor
VRRRLDDLVDAVARAESSVLVDCAEVSFIDAGGISSLVRAHGLGATVVGISGAVRRTLAIVGLVEVLSSAAEATRTERWPMHERSRKLDVLELAA